MKRSLKLGLISALAAAALPLWSAEVAVLRNGFSITHERREVLGATTRLYLGNEVNSGYVDVPSGDIVSIEHQPTLPRTEAAPPADLVSNASRQTGLDSDLISSVIKAESGFNPRALSRKGAQGLMQLMPQTAAQLGVSDAFDPQANVAGGSQYLRDLLVQNHLDLARALAAYNAGQSRVAQYHGVPPYAETQAYVSRIIRDFNRKKLAQKAAVNGNQKKTLLEAQATSGGQGK